MSNEIIVGNWSKWRQYLKDDQPQRKQTKYNKPPELIEFETQYNAHKYDNKPLIPKECRVRTKFSDKTANQLTAAIIAHLEFNGYFAARINTTGIYDSKRECYRTTNARRGMADIMAIINGKSVQLEIKIGNDRPRTDQIQVQSEVRAAGGIYEFIHNFPEYIRLYNQLTQIKPI